MTRGEHHRVVGFLAVLTQDMFGDRRGGSREVDVLQVILGDAVGGHHDQVTGANRNHLCRPDFRYAVADDARR